MIKLIMFREMQDILGSKKFIVSFGVVALLILLTFYAGIQNYRYQKSVYESAVNQNIKAMEGSYDWRIVSNDIFLPPDPLSALVNGISNDIGRKINVPGIGELNAEDSIYETNAIYATFRFLDLTFIFNIVLSLFAILFSYNLINGEKEQGTLKLVFSNPLPRDKFIIGKILGALISIIVPFLLIFLSGCLFFVIYKIPMDLNSWMKLIAIIFCGLLYVSVFITIAVFFSAGFTKSSLSFLYSLVVWIFLVIIVPGTSVYLSSLFVEVPSIDAINSQKNAFNRQTRSEMYANYDKFQVKDRSRAIEEFNKFMNDEAEKRQKKLDGFYGTLNDKRINSIENQKRISLSFARISPSSCFILSANEFAGTSFTLADEFIQQAKTYQKLYEKFQIQQSGDAGQGGVRIYMSGEERKKIKVSELPKFVFNPVSFPQSLFNSLIDIILLLLFNSLFFSAAYFKFLKYDLR